VIGTIKLCDFECSNSFTLHDVDAFRPIADSISNILHLYNLIHEFGRQNDEYDTLLAESTEALDKLQIGERLTYQFLTATSHLHELAGILSGMASDREEFRSVVEFSSLSRDEKDTLNEVIDRYVEHRDAAEKKLRELLRDRPDNQQLFKKPHNIKALVNEELSVFEKRFSAQAVKQKKSLKNADVTMTIDASALKYVVRILLNNALWSVSSTNQSPRVIELRASRGARNLLLRFTDNGLGIKPEIQRRIFEAFYTTRKDGTGIGLFWARKVIEDGHGGRLILDRSYPGQGATFLLSLPLEGK